MGKMSAHNSNLAHTPLLLYKQLVLELSFIHIYILGHTNYILQLVWIIYYYILLYQYTYVLCVKCEIARFFKGGIHWHYKKASFIEDFVD